VKKKKLTPAPAIVPVQGALKVAHWTITNGSGMHRVAEMIAKAECAEGMNSILANPQDESTWAPAEDADVHVLHTHFPSQMKPRLTKPFRLVWVGHGTPDHVFQSAVEEANSGSYGHGDGIMLMQHWLQEADAKVTFWPRHKWIYDRMLTRGAPKTHLVPLGVDLAFWGEGVSAGKFTGAPSVFTAENCHYIKWPYDLLTAWPYITDAVPSVQLHAVYVPRDMHRQFFPWINANGAAYSSYISPAVFDKAWLRNTFRSTDFTVGLVRYGDLNLLSLEANAGGATTISYTGNPHADYWIAEGDQRTMADELVSIFRGEREKRIKTPVPDIRETARAMRAVYESIL